MITIYRYMWFGGERRARLRERGGKEWERGKLYMYIIIYKLYIIHECQAILGEGGESRAILREGGQRRAREGREWEQGELYMYIC